MVTRMSDQLGRVLGGRYRLVAGLGTGASAQVFLADDVTLHRQVAVKVLHPALAADEAFLRRFRDEARAAAALSHPNLMAVYDWGEDDGPYLVLEYLGGGSLRALLDREHRLSPAQALVLGLEAARALDVAHRRGFVHRDIKPANLLFGEDARLRIADFGLARALSEAGWTEPGDGLVGTARYAAPEQARGGRIDGKADVYALGLVLIEAVTGEVPLVREGALETMMARVDTAVPVPDELGALKPLLEQVGNPDPSLRPDAAELGRALVVVARDMERPTPLLLPGSEGDDRPPSDITVLPGVFDDEATIYGAPDATGILPPVPTDSPRRRRRWPWLVLSVLVLAGVAAGGILAADQLQTPSAAVPRIGNVSEEEALELIATADEAATDVTWEQPRVRREYNDVVPAGFVIRQDPAPRSQLDDGGRITLVVSNGRVPVLLPNMEGRPEAEARAALGEVDLLAGESERRHHETVPADHVLDWRIGDAVRPPEAPKGSTITLVVSAGPAPRTVGAYDSVDAAKAALEGMGLVVTIRDDFSDTVPSGDLVGTSPGAGEQVERGKTVTIIRSKGQQLFEVPTVLGMTYDEALDTLEAAGFVGGSVSGSGNRVRATNPAPGSMVPRGTVVNITLGR